MLRTEANPIEPHVPDVGASESVLLLGGGGWIGSRVQQALVSRGDGVYIADRNFFDRLVSSGPLLDLQRLARERQVGTVINCIRPADDAASGITYILASSRLAETCESSGLRLLHLGSAAEFGTPLADRVSEVHPCRPLTDYAAAKAAASSAVIAHGGTVIRPFNVVGPRQPRHTAVGDWVSQLRRPGRRETPVRLHVKDPTTIRDFVSLDFVAHVIADLVRHSPPASSINVCSGQPTSFGEMAKQLVRQARRNGIDVAFDVESDPEYKITDPSTIPRIVGNPGLLNSLGHKSQISVQELAAAALS